MVLTLILLPFLCGFLALIIPWDNIRRALLALCAFTELCLIAACWVKQPSAYFGGMLELDTLGLLMLSITGLLFFGAVLYALFYLHAEGPGLRRDFQGLIFLNAPETVFTACLLFFLGAVALVTCSQHLGLFWVGIETTTLATAPLLYFHRHKRSLEATWKYLIICSVGIALALLGNILLSVAWQTSPTADVSLLLRDMLDVAHTVHPAWFQAGFIFIFIGYGTKMGLAPMHTWLPDAHAEAPSLVSALLSGALLNCAFLGILRACQLAIAAGQWEFCSELLIVFGLISMGFSAMFIISQPDFKRMLAYSSVEHMGILSLGIGIGGFAASKGVMLHLVCHSLIKAALFFTAGNIMHVYHSKSCREITGLLRTMPISGVLWLAGFMAITGCPPFGIFVSEFSILSAALGGGYYTVASLYLLFLGIIFVGMITPLIGMCQGTAPAGIEALTKEPKLSVFTPICLLILATIIGFYPPDWLNNALINAARLLTQ